MQRQPENADGGKADNPIHHLVYRIGNVLQKIARRLVGSAQSQAQHQCPSQNADVVGICQGLHRIGNDFEQQVLQHLAKPVRNRLIRHIYPVERHKRRECKAYRHRQQCRHRHAHHIQHNHRPDIRIHALAVLCHGRHHQREHQQRRNRLERTHKQRAQQITCRRHHTAAAGKTHQQTQRNGAEKSKGNLRSQAPFGQKPFQF